MTKDGLHDMARLCIMRTAREKLPLEILEKYKLQVTSMPHNQPMLFI